jgi:hypothetical protein
MLKNINFIRLFKSTVLFILIAIIAYFVTFANGEGSFEESGFFVTIIVWVFKWVFILISFPVIFLVKFSPKTNPIFYFTIVIVDCIIYSLLFEILLVKYRNYKAQKSKIPN